MFYSKAAKIQDFKKSPRITAKTQDFVSRLQMLEYKLDKVEAPAAENKTGLLKESLRIVKEYIGKMLGDENDSLPVHLSCLMKHILNSRGVIQKKKIIKEEIRYIKSYINTQKGVYWDETNPNDILYIYWHSKNELNIIEKITSSIEFLEKETISLEANAETRAEYGYC